MSKSPHHVASATATFGAVSLPVFLTTDEVADLVGISRASVDRWVRNDMLPLPMKLGGAVVRFSRDEVLAFMAAQRTSKPMPARMRKSSRAK